MRCLCGGNLANQTIDYNVRSMIVGMITIQQLDVVKCDKCNTILLSASGGKQIGDHFTKVETAAINNIPIGLFIDVDQASQLLKMTTKDITNNKRISRGFIIHKKFGKHALYYRPSVLAYAQNTDGRIDISAFIPSD